MQAKAWEVPKVVGICLYLVSFRWGMSGMLLPHAPNLRFSLRPKTLAIGITRSALLKSFELLLWCCLVSASASGADIVWTNRLGGSWLEAANWEPNQVPGAADKAVLHVNGLVQVPSRVTVQDFDFVDGALRAEGGLTVNRTFVWRGGTLGGELIVAPTAALEMSSQSSSQRGLESGVLRNQGLVRVPGVSLVGKGSSKILNEGIWQVEAGSDLLGDDGSSIFVNSGTLRNLGGSATFGIQWAFTTSGLLEFTNGALSLPRWTGTNLVRGEARVVGAPLEQASITANSTLHWLGGTPLAGTLRVDEGGTLVLPPGGTQRSITGGLLENYGTVRMQGMGMVGAQGARILNQGLWQFEGAGGSDFNPGTGSATFVNSGILRSTASQSVHWAWDFSSTGTFETKDSVLNLERWVGPGVVHGQVKIIGAPEGSVSIASNAAVIWLGGPAMKGTLRVDAGGNLEISRLPGSARHALEGGAIENEGTVIMRGLNLFAEKGSRISNNGLWQIEESATFNTVDGSPLFLNTGTLRATTVATGVDCDWSFQSTGTLDAPLTIFRIPRWSSANVIQGILQIQGGLEGSWSIAPEATLRWLGAGTMKGAIHVEPGGTFELRESGGSFAFESLALDNEGTVRMDGLSLTGSKSAILKNRGEWTLLGGSTLTSQDATSVFINTGTLRTAGDRTTGQFRWPFTTTGVLESPGGQFLFEQWIGTNTLRGVATVGGSVPGPLSIETNAVVTWTSGTVTGDFLIQPGGTLRMSEGTLALIGGSLTNLGRVLMEAGTLRALDAVHAWNFGLWSFSGSSDLDSRNGTAELINRGILEKTGADASTATCSWQLLNEAQLTVRGGTLSLINRVRQASGTLELPSGTLRLGQGLELLGGRLEGVTTIQGTVINSALIAPGGTNSMGTLSITGDYLQTVRGTLGIDVTAASPNGTARSDQLAVSGRVSLGGVLEVRAVGLDPSVSGASFRFLSAGTREGTFSELQTPPALKELSASYAPTSVTLLGATGLEVGVPSRRSFRVESERAYFRLSSPSTGTLHLELQGLSAGATFEVYYRRGELPAEGAYDGRFTATGSSSGQALPRFEQGEVFLLVVATTVPPSGTEVALLTQLREADSLLLASVTPTTTGKAGSATFDVAGSGFGEGTTVELVFPTGVIPAENLTLSADRLIARFTMDAAPVGAGSLRVKRGSRTASLPITVTEEGAPRLEVRLSVPATLGRRSPGTLTVDYANVGTVPMSAPLLAVYAREPARLTLDPNRLAAGLWGSGEPLGFGERVRFLASGQVPGVLLPGERRQMSVYYAGLKPPWSDATTQLIFSVSGVGAEDTNQMNWAALRAALPADRFPSEVTEILWANLTRRMGSTWGEVVKALGHSAEHLAAVGEPTRDLTTLLEFELSQANGLSPHPILGSAVDAAEIVPGVPLLMQRVFPAGIVARNRLGPLGFGWRHCWEYQLERRSDGTAIILTPSNEILAFQPDSRGGFFSPTGTDGVLAERPDGKFSWNNPGHDEALFGADGRLESLRDTNGNRLDAVYAGSRLTELRHTSGKRLRLEWVQDRLSSLIHEDGSKVDYQYDAAGHLLRVTSPRRHSLQYAYSTTNGVAARHALVRTESPGAPSVSYRYDDLGRLVEMGLGTSNVLARFDYPGVGIVNVRDQAGNSNRVFFGRQGEPLRVENPATGTRTWALDESSRFTRITSAANRSLIVEYNADGDTVRVLNPAGGILEIGQSKDRTMAWVVDPQGARTTCQFDERGNPVSLTSPGGGMRSWSYDAAGQTASFTNQRRETVRFERDPKDGQIRRKILPDGRTFSLTYDDSGRVVKILDSRLGTSTYEWFPRGLLKRFVGPDGAGFQYDYDEAGRRTRRTGTDGYSLEYTYDSLGRLVRLNTGAKEVLIEYEYDAQGRVARESRGNGSSSVYTYDAVGRVLTIRHSGAAETEIESLVYEYDSLGNRTRIVSGSGDWTYLYSPSGELIEERKAGETFATYDYDRVGNRIRTSRGAHTTEYAANSSNEYTGVGDEQLHYDADGNLLGREGASGRTTYEYDSEGRLIAARTAAGDVWTYEYDFFGNRVRTTHAGVEVRSLHDPAGGFERTIDYSSQGLPLARYDSGYGLVRKLGSEGAPAYYAFDALGNTVAMTGPAGELLNRYRYDAFGAVAERQETVANDHLFLGKHGVVASGAGLYLMRARAYAPDLGRFTSLDPAGFVGGINGYVYGFNNPWTWIDASGASAAEGFWKMASGAIGMLGGGLLAAGSLGTGPLGLVGVAYGGATVVDSGMAFASGFNEVLRDLGGLSEAQAPDFPSSIGEWADRNWGEKGDQWRGLVGDVFFWKNPLRYVGTIKKWAKPVEDYIKRRAGKYFPLLGDLASLGDFALDAWDLFWPELANAFPAGLFRSADPNELVGPVGYPPRNYLPADIAYGYRINFENLKSATAPAQEVWLENPLDLSMDPSSLELKEVGFGDQVIAVPPGLQRFSASRPYRFGGVDFDVVIEARLEAQTRRVFATFRSVVRSSGLPPAAEIGFLPPEDGTGRGLGHLSYQVRAQSGLPTGTEIRNVAVVQFDPRGGGRAFRTDLVDATNPDSGVDTNRQALVTIDADLPEARVAALPGESTTADFDVSWSGIDVGSGVTKYDVYARRNNENWGPWLIGTSLPSARWRGENGVRYGFLAVAVDGAGNREEAPQAATPPEVETLVNASGPVEAHLVYALSGSEGEVRGLVLTLRAGPSQTWTLQQTSAAGAPWTDVRVLTLDLQGKGAFPEIPIDEVSRLFRVKRLSR